MEKANFLSWLAERLVEVYGERPNTDFVQYLRRIADEERSRHVPNELNRIVVDDLLASIRV